MKYVPTGNRNRHYNLSYYVYIRQDSLKNVSIIKKNHKKLFQSVSYFYKLFIIIKTLNSVNYKIFKKH